MISNVTALALEVAVRALLAPSVLASRWLLPAAPYGEIANDLPSISRSPLVAAKVIFDEMFFMSEVLLARFVTGGDRERLRAEIVDALGFFGAAGWLADPASYYPAPPALEPRSITDGSSFGRPYRHLTFASEYEPRRGEPGGERWHGRAANRTAHAWLLQHPGPPRPWLICLHGYRTGSPLTGFFQFSPRWLHESARTAACQSDIHQGSRHHEVLEDRPHARQHECTLHLRFRRRPELDDVVPSSVKNKPNIAPVASARPIRPGVTTRFSSLLPLMLTKPMAQIASTAPIRSQSMW